MQVPIFKFVALCLILSSINGVSLMLYPNTNLTSFDIHSLCQDGDNQNLIQYYPMNIYQPGQFVLDPNFISNVKLAWLTNDCQECPLSAANTINYVLNLDISHSKSIVTILAQIINITNTIQYQSVGCNPLINFVLIVNSSTQTWSNSSSINLLFIKTVLHVLKQNADVILYTTPESWATITDSAQFSGFSSIICDAQSNENCPKECELIPGLVFQIYQGPISVDGSLYPGFVNNQVCKPTFLSK